eukprot:432172-Prorocentrum_minimum.AAC.1
MSAGKKGGQGTPGSPGRCGRPHSSLAQGRPDPVRWYIPDPTRSGGAMVYAAVTLNRTGGAM